MLKSLRLHALYNLSLYLIILFSALPAAAQTMPQDDEAVIEVSAKKLEQEISGAVEEKSVLSQEEIQKSGAKTVGDALKSLPEITVTTATAGNASESVSMQGKAQKSSCVKKSGKSLR